MGPNLSLFPIFTPFIINFTVLETGCVSLTLDPWVYPISPGKLFRSKVIENY